MTLLFNNADNKYKSLAVGYKSNVEVVIPQKSTGFFLIAVTKRSFLSKSIKVLLVYRSHQESLQCFFYKLSNFLEEHEKIDIICGDFNIDLSKINKEGVHLQTILLRYKQQINYPTQIDGGIIDHIYFRHELLNHLQIEKHKNVCEPF